MEPLDEQYLEWLYSQVGSVKTRNRSRTYWSLLGELHKKPFVGWFPNDDNRAEDGKDLRYQFLGNDRIHIASEFDTWVELPCSFLEMLVALAGKLSFEDGGEPRYWFWHLIENIELDQYNDRDFHEFSNAPREISDVLERVIWRRYNYDGRGGLFPLDYVTTDQRQVEIWYQMQEYLIEQN